MKKYLVFDIGGTFVKWAITNDKYEILENSKWVFNGKEEGKEILVKNIINKIKEIELKHKILAIGISTSGIVDPKTSKLLGESFNIKNMKDCNFKKELKNYVNLEIFIENDANAAILGEYIQPHLNNYQNVLMITLGTGIGGGIIINKNIYRGNGLAGEIGHQIYNGKHFEFYYSTIGLMRMIKDECNLELNTYEILASKNKSVQDTLDKWYTGISHILANAIVLMNFDAIVIGGGISESDLFNLDLIETKINNFLPHKQFHKSFKLFKAKSGNNAALLGMTKVINDSFK